MADKLIPVAKLDGTCVWVPSKDAAAIAALKKLPTGTKEYSGALYRNEKGEYCYSEPIQGDDDSFQFQTDKTPGLSFDGIYHTHPGGPDEKSFSPNDVAVARQLRKDSYIRANQSGEVRKFVPGVSMEDRAPRMGGKTSRGTVVDPYQQALVTALRAAPTE